MQFDRVTRVPAWELRVDDEGATGAQPARPVHKRRHPAAPVTEPMTERQRLDRALPILRLAVASEGELVVEHEVAIRAGRVPSAYRRRRPGPDPMGWPTRRLTASDVPTAVQRYRARTSLIGLHLIANLDSVFETTDADGRVPWMPDMAETPTKSDFALAEALISTKPDFGASYDEARRARSWFLLQLAWYKAGLSLDFETMGREVARQYRVEDGGRLQGDTEGKVWWTASGRFVQRWCADQRVGFRKDLRDARLRSRLEGW